MEMESGKLFVGGISWETNEERLREYFQAFGEVVEAVVMRDRATGRSRGFGFIVFADASVAEQVVKEKHVIDGRTVEAKKAVPRDDLQNSNRNSGSIQGSPSPARTKKIFVGGLSPMVTESDFKKYFEQFGTVTDLVVMYDHNTQRPRGFGFITYDSEEAVDKVLVKTFHELNGKMVEVKRAVPKELSPGPTRSPSSGYANGVMSKNSSFLNAYTQGYLANSPSGYGMRLDSRFSPSNVSRIGYPPYSPSHHSIGSSLEPGFNLNYGPIGGLGMNSYFGGNSSRYDSPLPYDMGSSGNASFFSTGNRNVWGNPTPNYSANPLTPDNFFSPANSNAAGNADGFGGIGDIWGFSPVSSKGTRNNFLIGGNINYNQEGENVGGMASYARNSAGIGRTSLHSFANIARDGGIGNHSLYSDHSWLSPSPELEGFGSFDDGRRNAAANTTHNNSVGYPGNNGVVARPNPRIAA